MHHWFLLEPNAVHYKAMHDQLVERELERLKMRLTAVVLQPHHWRMRKRLVLSTVVCAGEHEAFLL
jgi:hypothetical protein